MCSGAGLKGLLSLGTTVIICGPSCRETMMKITELRKIEKRVLKMVGKEVTPISTTELLTKYHDDELDPDSLRRAVWNLVGEAKLAYTEDRRLVIAAAADPA
jgi:hypothetical protein